MLRRFAAVVLFCALVHVPATAEILFGIEPLSTLGDVKKRYPGATFTRIKAAWVQDDQVFLEMTGTGFPGKLRIAFTDFRVAFKREAERREAVGDAADFHRQMAAASEDDGLEVEWLRWAPEKPMPLERFKTKYGEPKCGYDSDSMQPFCEWTSRDVRAHVSDDMKLVGHITVGFTRAEMRTAYKRRHGYVPDWLAEPAPPKRR